MTMPLDDSWNEFTVFYDSFNNNIRSEETRTQIKDEVEKLGQTLLQLNRNFATIQRQVDKIDKKAVIVDSAGQVKLYAPRWKKLHRKFTGLMNTSRVMANRVKGCIGTLLHAVLPVLNEDYPREAQEASLLGYIKTLERFESDGQEQDNDFSTFRDQIENFRTDLYQAATRRTKEAVIAKAKIDAEIAHLEAKLRITDGLFSRFWQLFSFAASANIPFSTTLFPTGQDLGASISALEGLRALAPIVVVGVIALGVGALAATSSRLMQPSDEESKERAMEVSKLKLLSEGVGQRVNALQTTVADLKDLDHTFNDITPRLYAIQSIWRMLITDAQTLRERLQSMPLAGHTKGFILYARTVQAIYGSLYYALDQYCLAV